MTKQAQVVIVGGGLLGASTAYHLALRGCRDVVVLEKEPRPASGSSARSLAGVRHQFSSPTNVALSLFSVASLQRFRDDTGVDPGLRQVGYLFLLTDEATWQQFQQNVAMQRSLGARVELLAPEEAARHVPGMVTDGLHGATFGPDDGYCDPQAIAGGYFHRAEELGVQLLLNTSATGFDVAGGRVRAVQTTAGTIACEAVVNTGGAWAGAIGALAGIEVPISPSRRNIYVTEPFAAIAGDIPLTIDMGSGFFMRSDGPGGRIHMGMSNVAEPVAFNTSVDWGWLTTVQAAGLARFPLLAQSRLAADRSWAGLYEMSPDGNPVLGRHPDLEGWVDACGFSGHGVQHAPATGMLMAEEILDGRAHTIDINELRLDRFRGAAAQREFNIV